MWKTFCVFLIKNKVNELILKNNENILKEPINAPRSNLNVFLFLLSIIDTPISSNKSKIKFINKTKSTYTFIYITLIKVYKKDTN